jgi:hypothetical protein
MPLMMLADDVKFNNERLAEQKEIRAKGSEFQFNLRYTCTLCGKVFISKKVKRK